jgi:hypothetical protein
VQVVGVEVTVPSVETEAPPVQVVACDWQVSGAGQSVATLQARTLA